jgi:hypothetical protein
MLGCKALRASSLGALLAALLLPRPSLAADVKITDAAREHFTTGVALLKDPDGARYEEAYREFRAAYDASPSWKILGNLGICAMKLERDSEAIDAFTRYLEEGKKDIDASERADIQRDLGTLRASTVSVAFTTTPAEVTITDERTPVTGSPVRNRYQSSGGSLRIQVRPGHHLFTASAAGKPSQSFELDAEPGSLHEHAFDLNAAPAAVAAPPPPPVSSSPQVARKSERPVPTGVWIGLAATGAFAVGAGVTGALSLGKNSDYEKANGVDAVRAKDLQDQTKTLNLVTDVLVAAAVVGAGVTTYLYLKRPERDAMGLELRLVPRVGVRSGLSLEGAF